MHIRFLWIKYDQPPTFFFSGFNDLMVGKQWTFPDPDPYLFLAKATVSPRDPNNIGPDLGLDPDPLDCKNPLFSGITTIEGGGGGVTKC
jgi:hypothetical protein